MKTTGEERSIIERLASKDAVWALQLMLEGRYVQHTSTDSYVYRLSDDQRHIDVLRRGKGAAYGWDRWGTTAHWRALTVDPTFTECTDYVE